MPTHNDPRLLWVRYSPQTMLLDTATMTLHAEVAHRRLSDFALSAKPWLAPESAAFLSVTRLTPENLASALVELKSAGWRIRNHMLWHSHLNAEITSSQAMRQAGHTKAAAAARSRWHRPPGTTARKSAQPPPLAHAPSIPPACSKHAPSIHQALLQTCTDQPINRSTYQPDNLTTDSSPVGALNGEQLTVNQPVAAASPLSGSTPLQEGERPNPKAAEERFFLADLLTILRRFDPKLASAEMANWGGWWRNAFRTNPAKTRRVLAELSSMIAEHRVHTNPGAAAADLWKRLPD
jgi:hypothetical protein